MPSNVGDSEGYCRNANESRPKPVAKRSQPKLEGQGVQVCQGCAALRPVAKYASRAGRAARWQGQAGGGGTVCGRRRSVRCAGAESCATGAGCAGGMGMACAVRIQACGILHAGMGMLRGTLAASMRARRGRMPLRRSQRGGEHVASKHHAACCMSHAGPRLQACGEVCCMLGRRGDMRAFGMRGATRDASGRAAWRVLQRGVQLDPAWRTRGLRRHA